MAKPNSGVVTMASESGARENLFRPAMSSGQAAVALSDAPAVEDSSNDSVRSDWREMVASRGQHALVSVKAISHARLRTIALQQCLPIVLAIGTRPGASASLEEKTLAIKRLTETVLVATTKLLEIFKTPVVEGSPLQSSAFQLVAALVANDWRHGVHADPSDYAQLCAGAVSQHDVEAIGAMVMRHRIAKSEDEVKQEIALILMRENAALLRQAGHLKGAGLNDTEREWVYRLSDRATDLAQNLGKDVEHEESANVLLSAISSRLAAAFTLLSSALENGSKAGWSPTWQAVMTEFERSMQLLDGISERQAGRLMGRIRSMQGTDSSMQGHAVSVIQNVAGL